MQAHLGGSTWGERVLWATPTLLGLPEFEQVWVTFCLFVVGGKRFTHLRSAASVLILARLRRVRVCVWRERDARCSPVAMITFSFSFSQIVIVLWRCGARRIRGWAFCDIAPLAPNVMLLKRSGYKRRVGVALTLEEFSSLTPSQGVCRRPGELLAKWLPPMQIKCYYTWDVLWRHSF